MQNYVQYYNYQVLRNVVEIRQALGHNCAAHDWRHEMAMQQPHSC